MKSRLKEILYEERITQMHLVRKTGANKSTINRIVHHGQIPSLPLAYRIAKELGLKIEDIWYESEENNEVN